MHLLYLLLAAIPLHLPVDISRPTSPAFPAYHGETLEIEAELKDRGTAFNVALTSPQLYYQTPGMGNNWWTLPATQTNNLLRATFPASADPGEDRLVCFLGSAGENFRAAFILNFRHSPGAVPNTVELPSPTLDFSQITILNSPYETIEAAASAHTNLTSQISAVQSDVQAVSNALVAAEADLSDQIAAATPADYATISNRAMTAVQTETDPTVSSWAKADTKPSYTLNEVAPDTENWLGVPGTTIAGKSIKVLAKTVNGVIEGGMTVTSSSNNDDNMTKYRYGGVAVKRGGTNTDYLWDATSQSGIVRRSELGDYATTSALAAKADASQVTTIINYLEGDDARVAITNFDSQAEMPTLLFERKVSANEWQTIWDEQTRWNTNAVALAAIHAELAALDDAKADRAWGAYDSSTGNDAPAGYTWISSPHIALSGGYSFEKHITTMGGIYLLENNGLQLEVDGVSSNSYFKITDDNGDELFAIVKGAKRIAPAEASDVETSGASLIVLYNIVSTEHPTISCCLDLSAHDWKEETDPTCSCTVAWSGQSGAWVATLTPKSATDAIFAKAEVELGGDTYIKNTAPTMMSRIILNGVTYQLGTDTISGQTVLTLTEVP